MSESQPQTPELAPKRIIVEVGTAETPFPYFGTRKIGSQETYLGFDINRENIVPVTERKKKATGNEGNLFVTVADGMKLPLQDTSIDEIVFSNILSRESCDKSGFHKEILQRFFNEAARVLKRSGKITLVEIYTPELMPLPTTAELFDEWGGFQLVASSVGDKHVQLRYSTQWTSDGYIAEFVRPKPSE